MSAQGIGTQTGTRYVERVVGYQVARRAPEGVLQSTEPAGAELGEQAALARENGTVFHHLQKIVIFERFFRLKLKQNRYSTPYI
jgi:predicted secreted Zn-dependent protease